MKKLFIFIIIAASVMVSNKAEAQMFAAKTNLQLWLTGTVSLGAEVAVSPKVSLEAMAYGNFIPYSTNYKFNAGMFQPGVRFWFSEVFSRSFVGVNALVGGGDFTWNGTQRQGLMYGAGFSYGYAWLLGARWNLEAEVGVSVAHGKYRVYDDINKWSWFKSKTLVLPSKFGLSLSYLF